MFHSLDLSDVMLVVDLGLAVFLALFFALGKPRVWYRDRLGWVIFGYAVAVIALLGLIVYAVVTGQRIDEWARIVVAGGLGLALLAKIRAIALERRRGRMPGARPYRTKTRPEMETDTERQASP